MGGHADRHVGHGHTFMGVAAPFGAVQLGPNNFNKGWDWCSGYHNSDSICVGFAHLHLNGTGCSAHGLTCSLCPPQAKYV